MKTRYIILTGAAVMLSMASCSILPIGKKVKKEAVLPQDREQIQQQATLKTYTPEEARKGVVRGDWAIEEVAGKKAVGQTAPFLKFVPEEHRVYGNNGCNTINAEYKYNPADSTMSFDKMISTMMACSQTGITDYEVNAALGSTRKYSWEIDDNSYYLYLYAASGEKVMTLMHQNFHFLNGVWRVVSIEDEPVDVPDMKLVIDVDEGKIHGNTGCNVLNGSFETDMEVPNAISFQKIATTRMACPEPNYEMRLLVALEAASHAKPVDKDRVLLLDDQNKVVLTLVRTTDHEE